MGRKGMVRVECRHRCGRTEQERSHRTEPLKSTKSKQQMLHFGKFACSHSLPIIAANVGQRTSGCFCCVAIVQKLPSASVWDDTWCSCQSPHHTCLSTARQQPRVWPTSASKKTLRQAKEMTDDIGDGRHNKTQQVRQQDSRLTDWQTDRLADRQPDRQADGCFEKQILRERKDGVEKENEAQYNSNFSNCQPVILTNCACICIRICIVFVSVSVFVFVFVCVCVCVSFYRQLSLPVSELADIPTLSSYASTTGKET